LLLLFYANAFVFILLPGTHDPPTDKLLILAARIGTLTGNILTTN